jgi:GT2 family glycosyltransferase
VRVDRAAVPGRVSAPTTTRWIRPPRRQYVYILNPDTLAEEGSCARLADVLDRHRRAAGRRP